MISLLLTMTRHGSKVCMLVYTPLLFQLKRFSTVQLGYKVKLTWRDLTCCMQVSCEWPRKFPREWLAYSTQLLSVLIHLMFIGVLLASSQMQLITILCFCRYSDNTAWNLAVLPVTRYQLFKLASYHAYQLEYQLLETISTTMLQYVCNFT